MIKTLNCYNCVISVWDCSLFGRSSELVHWWTQTWQRNLAQDPAHTHLKVPSVGRYDMVVHYIDVSGPSTSAQTSINQRGLVLYSLHFQNDMGLWTLRQNNIWADECGLVRRTGFFPQNHRWQRDLVPVLLYVRCSSVSLRSTMLLIFFRPLLTIRFSSSQGPNVVGLYFWF